MRSPVNSTAATIFPLINKSIIPTAGRIFPDDYN